MQNVQLLNVKPVGESRNQ